MRPTRRAAVIGAAALGLAGAARAPARRIVSLNPCLDAILLSVADPAQITALSHYSRDPRQSVVAAQARRFPSTWGSAEEVVALKPDLVLTSGMGALALTQVLPRLGVRQESFTVPSSIDESLAQVERVADQIDAGMVFVNCVLADGAELPFGGVKRSGFGREMGRLGATEFVNKKLIRIV